MAAGFDFRLPSLRHQSFLFIPAGRLAGWSTSQSVSFWPRSGSSTPRPPVPAWVGIFRATGGCLGSPGHDGCRARGLCLGETLICSRRHDSHHFDSLGLTLSPWQQRERGREGECVWVVCPLRHRHGLKVGFRCFLPTRLLEKCHLSQPQSP